MFDMVALIVWTNENSISGMIAQKNNIVSYTTILLIVGIVFTLCNLSLIHGLLVYKHKKEVCVNCILSFFSPLISSLILICPLVVYKTSVELGYKPCDGEGNELPCNNNKFEIKFYQGLTINQHEIVHYGFIGLGVILGYYVTTYDIYQNQTSPYFTLKITSFTISFICSILFIFFTKTAENNKRVFVEFIFLYYYITNLLLFNLVEVYAFI